MTALKMNSEATSTTAASPVPSSPAPERFQATSPKSPRRDDEFYCQDIVFLVEDVLFKVPRRPFEHESEVFSGMFALPPVNSPYGVEGSSDDNPIQLEGVTEDEFKALLWVMFRSISLFLLYLSSPCYSRLPSSSALPPTHRTPHTPRRATPVSPIPSGYGSSRTLTQPQWVSVLRLSTMWFFKDIRTRAIAELSKLVATPAARIVLARTYNISGWTEPALCALAQQDAPLSAQDLEALGWDAAAKLVQIRESVVFAGACVCGCNYCTVAHGHIATATPGAGAAGVGVHGHGLGLAAQQSAGPRAGQVTVASLRKKTDFSQQIRALFGTALY
ncbi:hypothetical protein GSI_04791 [Ganoderma sinense ZZ0214-1]|uniref:BTB domain-containing protein n=1 Tax=Ganoderma sinense ZZ0214-1 TaxID=1077348 RepID=A0A2G8SHV9_9APHY|nr:hypothetical protein GSI_04791 [Ganoderma sinense ZZ0214-1]